MRGAIVVVVLVALLGAAWFFLRKKPATAPVTGNQYVPAPVAPPSSGAAATVEHLSTAACSVAAKAVGIGAIGSVCKYTPLNIAIKAAPAVGAVAQAGAKAAAAGVVTGAKAVGSAASSVGHAASSVLHSIF